MRPFDEVGGARGFTVPEINDPFAPPDCVRCTLCHGADLKGMGPVPGLAARSPIYVVRQLYSFQHGLREGTWSDLMKEAVAKLTTDDMVAIAAYAASRKP